MRNALRVFTFSVALACAFSCASYKTQFSKESAAWERDSPASELVLKHTMYLIGDAGNDSPENRAPVLEYLKTKLETESKNSSALFLGDNIYEHGMPPSEDSADRKVAEFRIISQLETLDKFKGTPIFLPGNHDWRGWGVKGLKRQEKFVDKYINEKRGVKDKEDYENYFLPLDGCSGPEVIELNDNVVVIVVDSQWWLTDWDKDSKINDGCEIKNREQFRFVFENVVRKYRSKNVVFAMHHPPYTYGPHGGRFTIKQHIFPLTELNPDLWIPLPVLGSISALFRATIGSRQDVANKHYKDLRTAVMAGAKKNGKFIFASGHEHALQFIENDNQEFIVSGSGSKNSPVGLGKGSRFASSRLGYSTINFYEGGEAWTNFWEVSPDGKDAKLVFRKKIKDRQPIELPDSTIAFTEYNEHKDSTSRFVTSNEVKTVGGFHKFLLGEHNRNLYTQKYPFPVLDLAKYKGGLTPVKQGGGNQTNSLRLRDGEGKEYALRGLTKDVSRFLPFPFNQMIAAKYLVEDNFLSTNPFAPLCMPILADAVKVYHTNPKLYYVPAQPGLATYNSLFGGTMNLLEERPDGKRWKQAAFFGNPDKIVSTPELVESMLENGKNKMDEEWAIRTRLFDFVVGDWDRHDDQWAWSSVKQKDGTTLYRPIPRDRDQAFSMYDGLLTGVARLTLPFLRQLQSFSPEIQSMKWTTWSARLFDRTFLNQLTWAQWEEQAKFIQQNLTDQVITSAFANWPGEARKISSPALIQNMKSRRDNLLQIARTHYEFVSENVNVIGTEEEERIVVDRIDEKRTKVSVYEKGKDGRIKHLNYERIFDSDVTKAINVYGNGDDDEFIVKGDVKKGIKVRFIGGLGADVFADSTQSGASKKKTLIYDDLRNNTVVSGPDTKDKRSNLYRYNVYDRRSADSNYDIAIPAPILGVNPDDGLLLGASATWMRYGFKKEPYASLHAFGGSYAFATKGFKVNYTGDFINAFKKFDFYLDTYYHGPTYAFNYAGIGNDTERPVDDPDYYRVRQSFFHIYPALKKRFAGTAGFVTLGPFFELSDIQPTSGRFITSAENGLSDDVFHTKMFAGGKFLFDFNSVDNLFAPHTGIRFNAGFNWTTNLDNKNNFGSFRAKFAYYTSLDARENIILATQVGTGLIFGDSYEFFQMPTLGGKQGLRGYRTERFYGNSSIWHDTDLRIRLGSSYNPTLPLTYGVFGSFDHGRVWLEDDDESKSWHYSYGGGVWFAPVDILTLAVGAFIPKEKKEEKPRIAFQIGFWF
ncbi:metallophosphoesterase [Dyadobacter psychrophilus]|uniref:Calcineurin-like phosphoesterase n=1 Tax=Dyadobacter psychrophilus TaxID=651661 RepID=A0A1T5F9S5_9BACT|nr:metallophosphoesterase [Dyadobacter psychrophilus]SKB92808.1 Calcineurin-like phosphoesterase [Dyadobacter psychrophilus]